MAGEDLMKARNSPATERTGTNRPGKPSDAYGRFRETGPADRYLPDGPGFACGDGGVAFTLFSIGEGGEEARRERVLSRYVIRGVPRRT